jgi:signal transduction histidine kinase/ligand-binding sensor domain-containing protein
MFPTFSTRDASKRWVPTCLVKAGRTLSALVLGCTAFAAAHASSNPYLIDVWSTEKGLPNNSVTSIAQTPDGYLWVGTYNGLARFDGARFVTFDPENSPGLLNARIRKLYVDAQGVLWVNTYDGSLSSWRDGAFHVEWRSREYADVDAIKVPCHKDRVIFLLSTGEFIRRSVGDTNGAWELIEPAPSAKGLGTFACEDDQGTLWHRGRDGQLWRLVGDRFEPVGAKLGVPEGVRFRNLLPDQRGKFWVTSDHGLFRWNGERIENHSPTNSNIGLDYTFVFESKRGDVWLVADERLRQVRGRQWTEGAELWDSPLAGTSVMRLGALEQGDGTVWFYHYGLGLGFVRPDGSVSRLSAEQGFPGDRVDCLLEDVEGNLWAGVNRVGLVRLRQQRFQVISVEEGAQPAVMQTVCQDASGALWLGTAGSGLSRWREGRIADYAMPGGSTRGFVFSAYPGNGGELWLSAGEEDLFVLRPNGQLERCIPHIHGVKSLLVQPDSTTVWAGTKIGLFVCSNSVSRVFTPYPGFPRNVDVRSLAWGPGGVLWVGGGDGNLYRITSSGFELVGPAPVQPAYPIWSLWVDADGTVWAGTFRGGLLRYREGKFVRYTTAQGLPDNVISQILSEESGAHLWMGSHQGIFRVARSELDACARGEQSTIATTVYGRLDGLPSLDCTGSYQPACWRANDGRLWFATAAGAVAIQPGEVNSNLRPPPVVVEELLVDGSRQALPMGRERVSRRGRTEGDTSTLPELVIPPGKRQFEFRYTGLSFVSPDKVRFRYRLEGLERDWVEAGARRFAQYSYLRPGEYVFHVTACNNEGVWNPSTAALRLRVEPFFYETKPFVALLVMGCVGLILVIARSIYKRRLRRELEQLERQRAVERDRARIAKDIHDDLGAGLTQITLLSELARRDTPEAVEEHIHHISTTARELTRGMDEIVWAINPQNDTLDGLVTYISKFAQQYLTVAGIRCQLDVPSHLPTCVLGAEVRHNLYLALKEALNNVVKHAKASEVLLRLECFADRIVLSISDNGRGISASKLGDRSAERTSSGHGLSNMTRRLESIGGRCEITPVPEGGTQVTFTVRVKNMASPVLATGSSETPVQA